jgi:hypothetical protein
MSLWKGPVRWVEDESGAPIELQQALRSARAELGTREQIHRVARGLQSDIGKLNTSLAPGASFLASHPFVISGLKTLLSVFTVAIVGTVVLWHLPSGMSAPASAPNRSNQLTQPSASSTATRRTVETVQPSFLAVAMQRDTEVEPVKPRASAPQLRRRAKQVPEIRATRLDPEEELRILRRAQDDLVNRPLRALESTEQHLRDYPSGIFAQEREMIAIEALFQLNRVEQGMNRARRFLDAFGDSTHAPRVRSLLEESSGNL